MPEVDSTTPSFIPKTVGDFLRDVPYWPGRQGKAREAVFYKNHARKLITPDHSKNTTSYTFFHDRTFPFYPANKIPGTNLAAAIGPCTSYAIADLLESSVFSLTGKYKLIFALGQVNVDFLDYFTDNWTISTASAKYTIESKKIPNGIELAQYSLKVTKSFGGKKVSKLLTVVHADIKDGAPLKLRHKMDIKLNHWLFKKAQSHGLVIHCHAGVGRTGQIINQYLLWQQGEDFANASSCEQAMRSKAALVFMRNEARPIFIHSREQHIAAIENANKLYAYAKTHRLSENRQLIQSKEPLQKTQSAPEVPLPKLCKSPLQSPKPSTSRGEEEEFFNDLEMSEAIAKFLATPCYKGHIS